MCFARDSAPPIRRLAGAAISHERVVLTSADGTDFAAFDATPSAASETGVVILPDVRGLHRFYEELALRFAERGIAAIAFDFFGRTAGLDERGDDFDPLAHALATDPAKIQDDVAAAAARLRRAGAQRIFTLGFCFGARSSWLAASDGDDIAGAIGFYGRPGLPLRGEPTRSPIEAAPQLRAPILALMAGDDDSIPIEHVREYEQALESAGADYEIVIYEGAPHSFFDRKHDEFAQASDDAWMRTLDFIERHS